MITGSKDLKEFREPAMQVREGGAIQTDRKQVRRGLKQGWTGDTPYMKKAEDITKEKIQWPRSSLENRKIKKKKNQ